MDKPTVQKGDWIKIGKNESIDAYIFNVLPDGRLLIGYHQNKTKAIKEDVHWVDDHWVFVHQGPNGSYLHGSNEALVKRGPPPPSRGF